MSDGVGKIGQRADLHARRRQQLGKLQALLAIGGADDQQGFRRTSESPGQFAADGAFGDFHGNRLDVAEDADDAHGTDAVSPLRFGRGWAAKSLHDVVDLRD